MQKLLKFLFRIDDLLTNWPCQIALFILNWWGLQLTDSLFSIWVALGFLVYAFLTYNSYQNQPNYHNKMKELYKSKGIMPFLKGLNYGMILGPLSLGLFWLGRDSEEKRRNEKT